MPKRGNGKVNEEDEPTPTKFDELETEQRPARSAENNREQSGRKRSDRRKG